MIVIIIIIAILTIMLLIPGAIGIVIGGKMEKNKNREEDISGENAEKEGNRNFQEAIRAIYIYLILICALCAIIGGVIEMFNSGLDIILPEQYYGYTSISDKQQRNRNINNFTTALSTTAIAIPIFIYHNKIAKETRKKKV